MPEGRPNIVYLLNDHQAYYRHGWDQGPRVARPRFERLAAEGAVFERAYCAAPLCSPARRSMLTGVYPHRHGEIKNDIRHPYDLETYLDTLNHAGYAQYYYGKWHAGEGTAHDHGCEGFNYPSYNNPYTKPEYRAYLERMGLPEPEVLIEKSFDNSGKEGVEDGRRYRQSAEWCNEHAAGTLLTPSATHEAFFLANLAREKLAELASSGDDRPFSLRVDFWGPHQPYFPSQEFADLYDPSSIPVYPNYDDSLEDKPAVYLSEGNRRIGKDGKLIRPNPVPWPEWQLILARAYAQITLVDAAAGIVLDALEEFGFAENTMVLWTTDHGDALACHGGHFDKRSYMPEEMIRVPMALRFPGRVAPGQHRRELVNNVDVGPTILDAAGAKFPHEPDGRSLLGLVGDGASSSWRTSVVTETFGHAEDVVGRALVRDRYKYVWYSGFGEELYDLVVDPYEMHNLVKDPAHHRMLEEMRSELQAWRVEHADSAQ